MKQGSLGEEELKKAERIAYLVTRHLQGTLTLAEQDELDDWISASDENLELFEALIDEEHLEAALKKYGEIEAGKAAALKAVRKKLGLGYAKNPLKVWLLLVVAAGFLALILLGYFWWRPSSKKEPSIIQAVQPADLPPATPQAVLTFSDGRTLILNAGRKGIIGSEKGVEVAVSAGSVSYQGTGESGPAFHTLSVPRGGFYHLVLPDGSGVWLNSESSLRYPLSFTNQRRVELHGEGFFEVTKDPSRPFSVVVLTQQGGGGQITVLGTRFNVNGYAEDALVRTTLVEGSVAAENEGVKKIIQPGEEAVLAKGVKVIQGDIPQATAWKEGRFLFRDASIVQVGGEIQRWYDVTVAYSGEVNKHFNLEISREVPLSRLLRLLEGTGDVHFTLEGKRLIIRP